MDFSWLCWAGSDAGKVKPGDVIDCSLWHGRGCRAPNFVLIHVIGGPDNAPANFQIRRAKRMLQSPIGIPFEKETLRERAWRVRYSLLPPDRRQALMSDRQITITWDQAKSVLAKRIIVNNDDESLDEDVFIRDSDL